MWKLLRNLVIVAVLAIAVLKLVLWYEIQQGAARLATRLAPFAQVQYGGVSSGLDGSVDFVAVNVTVGKGASREVWRATQVELTTPGALWLVRRLLSDDESLPERLGITIKGLQAPAALTAAGGELSWLSPISLVPFETLGCGVVSRFSVADYQRMGLNPGAQQEHLDYRYDAANAALAFSAELSSLPFSTITARGELQKFAPNAVAAGNWQKLHVSELSLGYADGGYLAKRNRFCAQQAGMRPAQFIDQHLTAVATFLAERGVQPGAATESIYRSLVAEGGRVNVLSLPPAASSIGQLLGETPDVMTRQLNLTARRNDAPPVMVRLGFIATSDVQASASTAAVDAAPAASATAVVAAATTPSASGSPAPNAAQSPARAAPPAQTKPAPAATMTVIAVQRPAAIAQAHPAPAAAAPATSAAPTLAKPVASAPVAPVTKPANPVANSLGESAPPPPPGSTLALVWKPSIDRLPPAAPATRDFDVIDFSALGSYSGRFVRLLTTTGKKVEGRIIGVDSTAVGVRVKKAGGTAELQIPRSIIHEIQLPHRQTGDNNG
ncbi:MAG TPA: hypothetical protein VGH81_15055 [Rudaea sp.]|jgi:hypothetical protein